MNQEQIKYKISDAIHRKYPNADAFLFGSRARGDLQFDSDWDILIGTNMIILGTPNECSCIKQKEVPYDH